MTTTISKGKMFRVYVTVDDDRLRAMRRAPEAAEESLREGAAFWHSKIFPKHFLPPAANRYGYAARSATYMKQRAGKSGPAKAGKPALVFTGVMREQLTRAASFQKSGKSVALKMSARVLNFVKLPENSDQPKVSQRGGRLYPNMKKEIKAITDDEQDAVSQVVATVLSKKLDPSGTTNTKPLPPATVAG